MKRKIAIAAGAALALVAAFLGGYYLAPRRVEERVRVETRTVTETQWKDRIVVQKGPVRVVERVTEKPGAERVIEKWIERGPVTTTKDVTGTASSQTETNLRQSTVTEGARPGWAASVSAAWDPRAPSLSPAGYGLELDRRLFGTVWLGVRADADDFKGAGLRLGAALRLEF